MERLTKEQEDFLLEQAREEYCNNPNKMIISREEAEKKFTKGFINLVIDTAKPLTNMFGIDIFVTSEDIGKNALLFEYPVTPTQSQGENKTVPSLTDDTPDTLRGKTPKQTRGKGKWIAYRDGNACGVFDNRREAVKWFKELLQQTLKDFDKQDKSDEYDYNIEIKKIVIEPIKQRETFLGL